MSSNKSISVQDRHEEMIWQLDSKSYWSPWPQPVHKVIFNMSLCESTVFHILFTMEVEISRINSQDFFSWNQLIHHEIAELSSSHESHNYLKKYYRSINSSTNKWNRKLISRIFFSFKRNFCNVFLTKYKLLWTGVTFHFDRNIL